MDGHSKSIRCACEPIFFLSCLISAGLKALKFVCGLFGSSFVTDTCIIFLIDRGKCTSVSQLLETDNVIQKNHVWQGSTPSY